MIKVVCICMVQQERECEYRLDLFKNALSVYWWVMQKSQVRNEKRGCEILMIAHDVNFSWVWCGTSFCYYTSGTFPNNWNLDPNHAIGFILWHWYIKGGKFVFKISSIRIRVCRMSCLFNQNQIGWPNSLPSIW